MFYASLFVFWFLLSWLGGSTALCRWYFALVVAGSFACGMYGPRGGAEPDFSEERGKKMLYAAIALASVFAFERMGFDIQYRIKAVSMAPTLGDGEIIFSDPFSYALLGREIKREDIVVHQRPGGGNILNIHRVLGIPGDKVMVKFGWV